MKKIVTRIAPSPTGVLHIGTARTALFNYLIAKKNAGAFVVRIEDTDKERSTKEFEENILDNLKWLGLEFDSFARQSERSEIYKKYLEKMIEDGFAYISDETKRENYELGQRETVIRFKNPNKNITFTDQIRGEITFDTTELGDFVIAKSIDEPLYHLAVVIDDHEMGITNIIRGDDGISNTPRQILIQEAIGANRPIYAHLPLILGQDRSKLSKRHGAVSLSQYRKDGYLKEAIINFLAFLGWNPGTEQEFFTLAELIDAFSIEKVNKAGAIFNEEKLNWFNQKYLKELSDEDFLIYVKDFFKDIDEKKLLLAKDIILGRISNLKDLTEAINDGEFNFLKDTISYSSKNLIWKKSDHENTLKHLKFVANNFDTETIWNYAEKEGKGDVLWPLRYALSGKDKSPDPMTLIKILGKEKSIERIKKAINLLELEKNEE